MLQKASNVVVVCVTLVFIAALTGVTILAALNRPTSSVTNFIMAGLSGLGALGSAGALLYSSASAQTATDVHQQLNGSLDTRIQHAIATALVQHDQMHKPTVVVSQPSTVEGGQASGT